MYTTQFIALLASAPVAELDDGAQNAAIAIGYVLLGIGLTGGWKHWSPRARTLYCCVFPVHALIGSAVSDAWPFISPRGDRKAFWVIGGVLLLLLLMIAGC
jgi:hypothetical protein